MKNFLKYCLPAMIVLIGLFALGIAANPLQTWRVNSTSVANVDSNGSFNVAGGLTTLTTSSGTLGNLTGGTLTYSEPFAGPNYKEVIVGATGISTSAATVITWPTAFTQTPTIVASSMTSSSGTAGGALTYGLTGTGGTGGTFTVNTTGGTLVTSTSGSSGYSGTIVVQGQ